MPPAQARTWMPRWQALHRDLFVEANPIPVKWVLGQMGRIGAGVRLPLTPLAEEFQGSVALPRRPPARLLTRAGDYL